MEGGDFRVSTIDNRVVQMTFANSQFEQGVATSLASIAKLNQSLNTLSAAKGLGDIGTAADNVNLGTLASGVESIADKFKTLSIVGIAAITAITTKAVDAGIEIAKSFTIDPIKDGFDNYETQINAVQTILANTGLTGSAGLAKVNVVLAQLNTYANQTVYNFSEMAKNIGTFTAAGVDLNTSAEAIKGIANLAAMSGATSDQASSAMYQLSQAIASGTVKLQDWNSVVNAGLGGKTFQTALINTARANGVAIDSIIKQTGSFRNSLQSGWLTSDILTKTLSQFTGDLSVAQIKAMGYTAQQAQQIYNLSQTAVNAATKIKTMTQLTEALKEEVATAYAAIFQTIFGNITQATSLFSSIHNVAENALTKPIYDLNTLLQGWEKLGGRTVLIEAISDAFKVLGSMIKIVEESFREVFPPETAAQLYGMTQGLLQFVDTFKIGATSAEELKETFAGFFAVISIGIFVVKEIADQLLAFFGYASESSGGILTLTARIGNFLVSLKNVIENSDKVSEFFGDLGKAVAAPIAVIQILIGYVNSLFDKINDQQAKQALATISGQLSGMAKYSQDVVVAWDDFLHVLSEAGTFVDDIGAYFDKLAGKAENFFTIMHGGSGNFNLDIQTVLAAIDTGLFTGFVLLFKKLVSHFKDGASGSTSFIKAITEPFEALTKTLETMQTTLKAATLIEIAGAVLLLAIAVGQLAVIPQAGLINATSAIAIMFGELIAAMVGFEKLVGTKGFLKMPFVMASMIALALAIDILASAVTKLAKLDWNGLAVGLSGLAGIFVILAAGLKLMGNPQGLILAGIGLSSLAGAIGGLVIVVTNLAGLSWTQLAKGLTGVGALLISLSLFTRFADTGKAGAIRSTGIILLALAIKLLFQSVSDFSALSWESIGKGLAGVSAILVSLVLFTKFSDADKAGITQGVGIDLLAAAILILVQAVTTFSNMSWEEIGKGLTGVGSILVALTLFTKFVTADKAGLSQGAGIVLLASGIWILANAMQSFAKLSWDQIGKGITTMAGGLAIIGAALTLIPAKSLISAAAVFIVASSLWMISDAVKSMGSLPWGVIAKGVTTMAGALAAIAGALYLLPPSSILSAAAIFIVASSLDIIGDALAKMGKQSWTEIAKGLVELAGSLGIIVAAMTLMPEALPGALAMIVIAGALNLLVPILIELGNMSWTDIAKGLVALAGVFVVLGAAALVMAPIVPVLDALGVAIVLVGVGMLAAGLGLALFGTALKSIGLNVGLAATSIAKEAPEIANAMIVIMAAMLKTISTETPAIINTFLGLLLSLLQALVNYVPKMVVAGINLVAGILNGIASNLGKVITAGANIVIAFINGVEQNDVRIIQTAAQAIINFINSMSAEIKKDGPELGKAGANLALALIQGMAGGLAAGLGTLLTAVENLGSSVLSHLKGIFKSHSPSKATMEIGGDVAQGLSIGIDNGVDSAAASATSMGKATMVALSKSISGLSDQITSNIDMVPTITPVLDLTQVRKQAGTISGMISSNPLSVDSAYSNAIIGSAGFDANRPDPPEVGEPAAPSQVIFNQTNNSPKPIATIDVYRQTKNLVSKQRGAYVLVNGNSDQSG